LGKEYKFFTIVSIVKHYLYQCFDEKLAPKFKLNQPVTVI